MARHCTGPLEKRPPSPIGLARDDHDAAQPSPADGPLHIRSGFILLWSQRREGEIASLHKHHHHRVDKVARLPTLQLRVKDETLDTCMSFCRTSAVRNPWCISARLLIPSLPPTRSSCRHAVNSSRPGTKLVCTKAHTHVQM